MPKKSDPMADAINLEEARKKRRERSYEPDGSPGDDAASPPSGSEDAIAMEFVSKHGHELRYVAELGKWLRWDGCRWAEDRTLAIFDLIRPHVRQAAQQFRDAAAQRRAARAAMVAAVEKLARSDRRVAALADDFNADLFLINTPDGIVDLRTGEMRPCDPLALCTKVTAVGPAPPGTQPKLYAKFVKEITAGDGKDGLPEFLQRMSGYMLTGSTEEHALFFLPGTGANGKSVFVNTLRSVMGDYAIPASSGVFIAGRFEQHPTELARLRGARLVAASEVDKGKRWNEARIKELTGGDMISGRYMRQDFFDFMPQFKPLICGNHRPSLRDVNEAMRRRFNIVPFDVTIPEKQRDKKLFDKLQAEWPAILRWAIDGCLAWQRDGLAPPPCVVEATDSYMTEQDLFGQWLEECCERDLTAQTASSALFQSWRGWASSREEYVGTQKEFSATLVDHDFAHKRTNTGAAFIGVRLKEEQAAEGPSITKVVRVLRVTEKGGILVYDREGREAWLPRKAITMTDLSDDRVRITVPLTLAKEKVMEAWEDVPPLSEEAWTDADTDAWEAACED